MKAATVAIVGGAAALCGTVASFSPPARTRALQRKINPARNLFFADEAPAVADEPPVVANTAPVEDASLAQKISILDGSESSIGNAAKFMVDAFWLGSPQRLIQGGGDPSAVSDSAKASLVKLQADDLMEKYGERMGSRKLEALILAATEEGGDASVGPLSGMVTVEVRLFDAQRGILSADASEYKLTQAVASLGPKQRREYKGASVKEIANQLLPPDISAGAVLANLCVAPSARRRGVAAKLCREVECVVKEKLGFEEMFLEVEAANEAAVRLYEEKLGYDRVLEVGGATALRVDGDAGGFVEVSSDIVLLKKKIPAGLI